MSETALVNTVRLRFSRGDVRLFRNNVGVLTDAKGNHVTYGLCVGSSDLIGWRTVEVTPDMVGRRLAVFVAAEGKATGKRPTKEQRAFLDTVRAAGGRAGVFYSLEDVVRILSGEGT